ncbi:MAG: N-acetyl sugar amidotransferase [Marinilabiliales bacterium]
MDNVCDPEIIFDMNGVCNHCKTYEAVVDRYIPKPNERENKLNELIGSIKKRKKGKYDCLIGLSGGTDSSYVAYLTRQFGLNPLAVHFDNGWNSELSVSNIEKLLNGLCIDLYTYVVDWNEFKDLQCAYIKASVVDIEAITDHAIMAVLFKIARKFKIKYILSGSSIVTEGILPVHWIHNKADSLNIKDIHRKYGKLKLKSYPFLGIISRWFIKKLYDISLVRILDYVEYNRQEAQEILKSNFDWKDYGGKHYESIFTKFYQGYILPRKFKIDKRRSHLSTLICAGQIDRNTALELLKKPSYNEKELIIDKKFVLKKLGFSNEEFEELMNLPRKDHMDFRSSMHLILFASRLKQKIKRFLLP